MNGSSSFSPPPSPSSSIIRWAKNAINPPKDNTTKTSASLLMDWRRHLYGKQFDQSSLILQLRQSDENNNIYDFTAIDCFDELKDGQIMSLLSYWMHYGRSENVHGGSTWLNVRSINISGCNLSHKICELFLTGLHSTTPNLTALNMSANQIGGYSDEDDFFIPVLSPGKALVSLLKDNKSITDLRTSYCNMGMNTIQSLTNILTYHNRSVIKLDISANSLWWDEINVDELDSDRCFDTKAIYQIADMMKINYIITDVKVSAAEFKPWQLCGRKLYTPSSNHDGVEMKEDKRDNLNRISFGKGGNMGSRASRSDLVIVMRCIQHNNYITSLSLSGLRIDHEGIVLNSSCFYYFNNTYSFVLTCHIWFFHHLLIILFTCCHVDPVDCLLQLLKVWQY